MECGLAVHFSVCLADRGSREIKTPMLFGYSKPIIVLPHRRYHEEEAEMILRHEIQHYKNRDLWYKFLIMFVCDLYWFNLGPEIDEESGISGY